MTKVEILDGLERLAQVMEKAEFRDWGRFCRDTARVIAKCINASDMDKNEEMRRACTAAIETWGSDAQTLMVFEEMSELQKELCKHARGKDNRDNIADEIADVEIMLAQMKILHDCEADVELHRQAKLARLLQRLNAARGPEAVV